MTAERWERLRELYDEALALAPERRIEFVLNTCDDDRQMREQLLGLLTSSGEIDAFDEDATQVGGSFRAQVANELTPGSTIGRYTIVRPIGRGGMGAVYLAERADREFEHKVAIKLVAAGLLSSRIMARLRGERQILANLAHPNIARLYDGGATAEGVPYLVMEYVEGRPIDRYCQDHKLSIAERLQLFEQVCMAVQYAHTRLVIHRDIKPSNILVTEDGTPKLLDFGIAKLVDPNAPARATDLTRVHERVMSPEYASPEQVLGESVGTASDVYSLGVLLYELLTERRPYSFAGKPFQQIERTILEEVPPLPSTTVASRGSDEESASRADLAKQLRGDLDTIVMKAIHKDIAQRYPTASALAEDIRRYLANQPILARPDSLGYRLRKYWRRNRWTLASVTTAAVAVIALTIAYTVRLAAERDIAERERTTAMRVSQFMTEVFRVANPSESRGNSVPVREVLDAAVARIRNDLRNEPRTRVVLLQNMAQAYVGIGLWESAKELLIEGAEQARTQLGPRSIELAETLSSLAAIQQRIGDTGGQRRSLEEALAIRRALNPKLDRAGILDLASYALNQSSHGEVDAALRTLGQAESLAQELAETDPSVLGEVYFAYGYVHYYSSRYEQSARFYSQAVPLLKGSVERGLDRYAEAALQHGHALLALSQFEQATKLFEELLDEFIPVFGATHPMVGDTWNLIGISYCQQGDYETCSQAFQRSADIERLHTPAGSRRLMVRLANLGAAYHDAGRLHAAIEALDAVEEVARAIGHAQDPMLLQTYYEKAGALRKLGRIAEAEAVLAATPALFKRLSNEDDVLHDFVAIERGRILHAKGSYRSAADHLRKAIQAIAPEDKRLIANARLAFGRALLELKQCDDAIAEIDAAHRLRRDAMPEKNWFIYEAQSALGDALSRCGHLTQAEPHLVQSVERLRTLRASDDIELKEAELALERHRTRANAAPSGQPPARLGGSPR